MVSLAPKRLLQNACSKTNRTGENSASLVMINRAQGVCSTQMSTFFDVSVRNPLQHGIIAILASIGCRGYTGRSGKGLET